MIPDAQHCLALMEEYGMLANIKDHSMMVAKVAMLLGHGLVGAGRALDLPLVLAGALLHDIAKTQCLDGRCPHAEKGRDICLELGFRRVADIVAQHVVLADFAAPINPINIVYYADKRVKHDQIVSLAERRTYIEGRYGQGNPVYIEMIRENFAKCAQVENRIFSPLPFVPSDVAAQVVRDGDLW